MSIIGVLLIKSLIGAKPDARKTLYLLGLRRVNTLVLLPQEKVQKGMLQVAKDYITWGTVSEDLAEEIIEKRAKTKEGKKVDSSLAKKVVDGLLQGKHVSDFGLRRDIHLHPPTGGFKKSLKRSLSSKGETGDRGEKLSDLLKKMC